MIGVILTDHQIRVCVVAAVAVTMMNLCRWHQWLPHRVLCNNHVFKNHSFMVRCLIPSTMMAWTPDHFSTRGLHRVRVPSDSQKKCETLPEATPVCAWNTLEETSATPKARDSPLSTPVIQTNGRPL